MEIPNPEHENNALPDSISMESERRTHSPEADEPSVCWQLFSELKPRFVSSLVMVALFLSAEIIGGMLFVALVLVAAMLMIREWDGLTHQYGGRWPWLGLAYIAIPCVSLLWLRDIATEDSPHAGMGLVLYLVFVVSATDIGAYFVGKRFGSVKLAPNISPGKTWEGLAGGVVAAGIVGLISAIFTPYPTTPFSGAVIGMLLAFVAQGGDLFESWLKRKAGVKNSSNLIPGHGGILDRVDGLLTASVVFAFIVLISGFAFK
jgi:phosphatidate cytidylyltransferase